MDSPYQANNIYGAGSVAGDSTPPPSQGPILDNDGATDITDNDATTIIHDN
jgi:hypothetical protein